MASFMRSFVIIDIVKNLKRPNKKLYVDMSKHMTSSTETLDAIIHEVIDWKPSTIKRLVLGVGNEVYKLTAPIANKPDLILRINHKEHPEFNTEKWAFNEVNKQGVSVPSVLKVASFKTQDEVLTYCVETVLSGESLDMLLESGLDETEKRHYAQLAGETLARIHQVKTTGYGHWLTNGIGRYKTLAASMHQQKDYSDLVSAATLTELTVSELNQAIGLVDNVNSQEETHLIHCDYAPKHIFIDKGKVSGVIDFEICLSGLAATDFNRWRAQESRITMEELITGYEHIRPLPTDFWEFMYIAQIHSAIRTMLYHFRTTKHLVELNKAANEVRNLLISHKPLLV
jgi:Ser/Thr protein kinase RdoA (MazF antagonist)